MQCPVCGYEPTLTEMQASPDECVRCHGKGVTTQGKKMPRSLIAGVVALSLLGATVLGFNHYQRKTAENALYVLIDQKLGAVNGLSMELLDQGAGLTKAEFFTKAERRVKELDDVIVQILSVNDSARPGVAQAAAEYAKGARAVIKAVADQAMAEALMNVEKQGLARYAKHENDPNFIALVSRPESQLREDESRALAAVEGEQDMGRKIELLRDAKLLGDVHALRAGYLESKRKAEVSAAAYQKKTSEMEAAVQETQRAANRLRQLTDYDFRLSGWELN